MTSLGDLIVELERLRKRSREEFESQLSARKISEVEFHDRDRDHQIESSLGKKTHAKLYGNRKFYVGTRRSRDYVENWIRSNSSGSVFLDYACGNGKHAILAGASGASLSIGLDISWISVKNARRSAMNHGLKNVEFYQGDCEETGLPDDSIDVAICSGMLHHLDLSFTLPELRRIIRPGGRVLCIEALNYNPAIKLYRKMTPAMRTSWEKDHIMSLRDLRFARNYFNVENIRYWHVLSYLSGFAPSLLDILDGVDCILTRIPFIQQMAWIFTFELEKRR